MLTPNNTDQFGSANDLPKKARSGEVLLFVLSNGLNAVWGVSWTASQQTQKKKKKKKKKTNRCVDTALVQPHYQKSCKMIQSALNADDHLAPFKCFCDLNRCIAKDHTERTSCFLATISFTWKRSSGKITKEKIKRIIFSRMAKMNNNVQQSTLIPLRAKGHYNKCLRRRIWEWIVAKDWSLIDQSITKERASPPSSNTSVIEIFRRRFEFLDLFFSSGPEYGEHAINEGMDTTHLGLLPRRSTQEPSSGRDGRPWSLWSEIRSSKTNRISEKL